MVDGFFFSSYSCFLVVVFRRLKLFLGLYYTKFVCCFFSSCLELVATDEKKAWSGGASTLSLSLSLESMEFPSFLPSSSWLRIVQICQICEATQITTHNDCLSKITKELFLEYRDRKQRNREQERNRETQKMRWINKKMMV